MIMIMSNSVNLQRSKTVYNNKIRLNKVSILTLKIPLTTFLLNITNIGLR